jgi:hypothetical protein
MSRGLAAVAGALLAASPPLEAQSLAGRVAAVRHGDVRMSFTARPGVCGNGRNITTHWREDRHWMSDCEPGPVRVVLEIRDGRLRDIETYVGGRWRADVPDVEDLGLVPAAEAARLLLDLAGRTDGAVGKDAVFPATLADSFEAWPALLTLAKDQSRDVEVRKAAIFWVAQAAGERAVQGLKEVMDQPDEETEVRERAVFALSQIRGDAGVPVLIEVARTNPDPRIRKRAIFWLGQSNDPRVITFFEEILLRGNP